MGAGSDMETMFIYLGDGFLGGSFNESIDFLAVCGN